MRELQEEKNVSDASKERPVSYGGYSSRHRYEKNEKRPWQTSILAALFLLLFILSTVGLVALFRGDLLARDGGEGGESQAVSGKLTVPVLNTKFDSAESAVAAAENALVTVEVKRADQAAVYGTGFVLSKDGFAVCHTGLFEGKEDFSITVYAAGDVEVEATVMGSIPALGISVLRLDDQNRYQTITLGDSNFVRRGQALYGVSDVKRGLFNGLVLSGIAVSTAENVAVTINGEYRSISVLYTSIPFDETINGALLINADGNAVGFLTDSLPGRGGGMAAVPIVTLVGLANEVINAV